MAARRAYLRLSVFGECLEFTRENNIRRSSVKKKKKKVVRDVVEVVVVAGVGKSDQQVLYGESKF